MEMKLPLQLKLAGGAFVALMLAVAYIYHLGGEKALLKQRLHASDSTVAALTARGRGMDTLYRTDTLRLRVAVTRWDTVKAKADTITVPVRVEVVKEVIREADRTINACQVVVQTCEQRVANRDSIIVELRKQRPLLLGVTDSKTKRVLKKMGWVTLGAAGGYIAAAQSRSHP